MQRLSAGLAIVLLWSSAGQVQAREVIASKASTSPSANARVAPQVMPAKASPPSKADAEGRAYSELVDHVAKATADFADDNTTGNQDRDHVADRSAKASQQDSASKSPAPARKGKSP